MSSIAMSFGDLAGDVGKAFTQQRDFDLKNRVAQSQIGLQGAEARRQDAEAAYYNLPRWEPLTSQPVFLNGQWVQPMRNVRDPKGSIQYVPTGAPANSIQAMMGQMGIEGSPQDLMKNSPDLFNRLVLGSIFKGATGSANTIFQGRQGVWRQVPGGFQYGVYDKLNNQFSPASDVYKGLPQGITTWMDDKGNVHNQLYPTVTGAPNNSNVPAQSGTETAASTAPISPTSRPQNNRVNGSVRSWATAPQDVIKQLNAMQNEKGLLNDIVALLKQPDERGIPLWASPQGTSKLEGLWNGFLYSHGIHGDDTWDSLIQRGVLSGFSGVMGLIPGLRRGDLISQAMAHLPQSTDTMRQMFFKAANLIPIYDRNMKNLINSAQLNSGGRLMNQSPAESVRQLDQPSQQKVATTSDIQNFADANHLSYGDAYRIAKTEGWDVSTARIK